MTTATARQAESRQLMGTCSLTLRINETHYSVRGFTQTQVNWAWELRKLGTGSARVVYTVSESPDGPVCDCPSFEHRCPEQSCKHIRALTARGLIRPVAPAPRGLDGPAFDAEAIDAAEALRHHATDLMLASGLLVGTQPDSAALLQKMAEQLQTKADSASKPASPSKPAATRVYNELDTIDTPESLEALATECDWYATINPTRADQERRKAAEYRSMAARLRREAETADPVGPAPADATPGPFTLPDDIVAPDEPFALASQHNPEPYADATPAGEYSPIVALLRGARERGLKYPSIEIRTPAGNSVVLKLCGEKSRTPGSVNVSNGVKYGEPGAEFYGRIDEWGNPHGNLTIPSPLITTLRRLAADPAAVAAEHGHATGQCCFCRKELTDPKSVAVGYGPVCADRHSLPWG